jgi:hypothetical protein
MCKNHLTGETAAFFNSWSQQMLVEHAYGGGSFPATKLWREAMPARDGTIAMFKHRPPQEDKATKGDETTGATSHEHDFVRVVDGKLEIKELDGSWLPSYMIYREDQVAAA